MKRAVLVLGLSSITSLAACVADPPEESEPAVDIQTGNEVQDTKPVVAPASPARPAASNTKPIEGTWKLGNKVWTDDWLESK